MDTEILAISVNDLVSHEIFADRMDGVPFPMLSDVDMRVIRRYGVVHDKGDRARRSVFVLNRDGVVVYTNTRYNVHEPADFEALMKAIEAA
jgi:peroxiredoxin